MKFFVDHNIKEPKILKTTRINYTESVCKNYLDRNNGEGISIMQMIIYIGIAAGFICIKTSDIPDCYIYISSISNIVKVAYAVPLIITIIIDLILKSKFEKDKNNIKLKFQLYITYMSGLFCSTFFMMSILSLILAYNPKKDQSFIVSIMVLCIILLGAICGRYRSKGSVL